MSTPIGKKIRNIREALGMGRQEFADKSGINKGTLIGLEVSEREVMSGVLTAIAQAWPEYASYLLSDELGIAQKNPEVEEVAKNLQEHRKAS
jgi:transcriptional regulator with XRE-family HTH domain